MARRKQADENAARVRNLLAIDAANIMRRLEARQEEMVALFSRLRSREPMLTTIASRFTSVTFSELVQLTVPEQSVVNQFYESLDELRWYLTYTEDMPSTARLTISALHRRLQEAHRALVASLGHPASPEGNAVVDSQVVRRDEVPAPAKALARARPPRRRRAPSPSTG